jgi:hypothetical protein
VVGDDQASSRKRESQLPWENAGWFADQSERDREESVGNLLGENEGNALLPATTRPGLAIAPGVLIAGVRRILTNRPGREATLVWAAEEFRISGCRS